MRIGQLNFTKTVTNDFSFEQFKNIYSKEPYCSMLQTTIENAWQTLGGVIPPEAQAETQSETQITEQPKKNKKYKK